MELQQSDPCILCGANQPVEFIQSADWWKRKATPLYRYLRCQACGLIYQSPQVPIEEMAAHYGQDYELFQDGKISQLNRRRAFRNRFRVLESVKKGGSLLDIGCATGGFLLGVLQSGRWQAVGVEPDPYAAQIAREAGLEVQPALESAALQGRQFDAVTLWDVIEHLHQPQQSMQAVYNLLADDGVLILRLPNADSPAARFFGRYWGGLDAPRHLYVFTPATITRLVRNAGFQRVEFARVIGRYSGFVTSVKFFLNSRDLPPSLRRFLLKMVDNPLARGLDYPFSRGYYWRTRSTNMTVVAYKR